MEEITIAKRDYLLKRVHHLTRCMKKTESIPEEFIPFLKSRLQELLHFLPVVVQHIGFSQPFERIVINQDICGRNERLRSLEDLRYPPRHIAHKIDYNRASMKGSIAFYCGSMGPLPLSIETKPTRGQLITTSKWKLKESTPLNLMVLCQDIEVALANPNEILKDFNEHERMMRKLPTNLRTVVESFMT